jgi:hypothetical protein
VSPLRAGTYSLVGRCRGPSYQAGVDLAPPFPPIHSSTPSAPAKLSGLFLHRRWLASPGRCFYSASLCALEPSRDPAVVVQTTRWVVPEPIPPLINSSMPRPRRIVGAFSSPPLAGVTRAPAGRDRKVLTTHDRPTRRGPPHPRFYGNAGSRADVPACAARHQEVANAPASGLGQALV